MGNFWQLFKEAKASGSMFKALKMSILLEVLR